MNIGLLKENKTDEYRVALLPSHAKLLNDKGHQVFVEESAGLAAGFPDQDYINNNAIVCNKKKVLDEAEFILKVKAPLESEKNDYSSRQVLFTYLHFDENISPDKINELIKNGFLGIAYEWVEENNRYPLLEPMSILSGYLFAQKAVQLCTDHKRILCGDYEGLYDAARILIIGIGTIGSSVLKYSIDNHLKITVIDKNPGSLNQRLNLRYKTRNKDYTRDCKIEVLPFENKQPLKTKKVLSKIISEFDIVINCAVRRPDLPKKQMEYLIDRSMIMKMQNGSVVCDATACDKDLIETAISSEYLDHYDIIEGVIHYNCDHIPSLTANTSSRLLTESTFPYIMEMAERGIKQVIRSNESLRKGVSCYKAKLTHEYTARKKNLPWVKILDII